jgi:predicted AlkP superfamily pyrophosphatase or phosphodiesterase
MLPAPKSDAPSLADVLASCLESLSSAPNRLGLPPARNAVVVLVDGLGADALKARSGHARTLAAHPASRSVLESGFPTTTAAGLASLTTGVAPGQHGLVGYSVLDAAHDRVVNQLSGWDAQLDPLTWQRAPTLFETAVARGFDAVVIGPARYSDSGFTHAVLRGARYLAAGSIADRMQRAAAELRAPGPGRLIYVYVPELDSAAHAHGLDSAEWIGALETTDAALRDLVTTLRRGDGLLVTADHGVLDISAHSHVLLDDSLGLLAGIRHIAGEPRCLQLHFEPDADHEAIVARWRESEGARSWVVTRSEAIEAGWFGEVLPEVVPRIGDLLVAARKNIAYYDARPGASAGGRSMVGQHGSWSPAERRVPLIGFGAYA